MKNNNRNLLVLIKNDYMNEEAIAKEVKCLNQILLTADSIEQFCISNELVNRNRITSDKKKILKECRHFRLRPFRFLINKN
jgi:hypothetical protein